MAWQGGDTFIKPHLLFIEGKDEMGLIVRLLAVEGIESIQLVDLKGFTKLGTNLRLATKTQGWADVRRVGILLDSDDVPAGRLASIRSALQNAGLPVPDEPLTYKGENPAVCYSTVPDPQELGCLETLIQRSVTDDGVRACVDAYLTCGGHAAVGTALIAKRWVHAYLSRSNEPGLKIGEAVTNGLVDLGSAAFDSLRQFVRALALQEGA